MNQIQRFLAKAFAGFQTDTAAKARALVADQDWASLQKLRLQHPSTYASAKDYYQEALVIELFRKCRLPTSSDRLTMEAKNTFWQCEHLCKGTNIRLSRYHPHTMNLRDSKDVAVSDFISRWRKELKKVLGPVTYVLEPRFSQGATLSDNGVWTTIPDKMTSEPTSYNSGAQLYGDAFRFTPQGERFPEPLLVRGNRFFTVPKDSFKDRGCCVEASAMVSLQLAVGHHFKRRYEKSYGRKLQWNPLRHQRLARLASAGRRDLATIDLSNASDTVSYGLCQLVLPEDWFTLLNKLRASHTKIDGRWVRLEKFSSMGNGFTFELETLLYQTLCDTIVGSRICSAFGDDMIVPGPASRDVMAALQFFGFQPNREKTFCEGPFRESCGGDYFDGQLVRAYYLKELPDEPQHWIALANGLRKADPHLVHYRHAWRFCLDQLPTSVRKCRGPVEFGDIVIHDDFEPVHRSYKTVTNGKGYENSPIPFVRAYVPVAKGRKLELDFSYRVATAAATLGVPNHVVARDQISGYKLDWVPLWGRNDGFGWIET